MDGLISLGRELVSEALTRVSDHPVGFLILAGILFILACAIDVSDHGLSTELVKPFLRNFFFVAFAIPFLTILWAAQDRFSSTYPETYSTIVHGLETLTALFV